MLPQSASMKCKVPGHNSSLSGIGKRVHRAPVSPICLGFLLRLLENDHTFLEELLGPPYPSLEREGGMRQHDPHVAGGLRRES